MSYFALLVPLLLPTGGLTLSNDQTGALSCRSEVHMQAYGFASRDLRPHTRLPRNSDCKCRIHCLAFQRTSSLASRPVRVPIGRCCKLLLCVANFACCQTFGSSIFIGGCPARIEFTMCEKLAPLYSSTCKTQRLLKTDDKTDGPNL